MGLNLPIVSLVTASEVVGGVRIILESPQQPIENCLAKGSTICVTQCTAMTHIDVSLPGRDAGRQVPEVALTLGTRYDEK